MLRGTRINGETIRLDIESEKGLMGVRSWKRDSPIWFDALGSAFESRANEPPRLRLIPAHKDGAPEGEPRPCLLLNLFFCCHHQSPAIAGKQNYDQLVSDGPVYSASGRMIRLF